LRAEEERDWALEERPTVPTPVAAWPAPAPVMTQANFREMLAQQLLQRMAMPMPVTLEPRPGAAP